MMLDLGAGYWCSIDIEVCFSKTEVYNLSCCLINFENKEV